MDVNIMPFIWLGIALFAGILEASTGQLVSIWFVLGAVAAAVSCVFTDNITVQIVIFVVISLIAVAATRPLVKKFLNKPRVKTNSDRYIGRVGKVIKEINNQDGVGQINVSGSIWSARSNDGSILPVNTNVKVDRIEGVKLIVTPCKEG